jgi:hypothetical protein
MTLEINYPHSEHTIDITGTSVVPEFPFPFMIMAGAMGGIIAVLALVGRSRVFAHRI